MFPLKSQIKRKIDESTGKYTDSKDKLNEVAQ